MYDWDEVQPSTDRLWSGIRDRLRDAGMQAPEALTRGVPIEPLWTGSDMILAQSCGLPYVRTINQRMQLLGAPDYGVPGCAPGSYRSAIVIRSDDGRTSLAEFAQAIVAVNGSGSQSGYAALAHHVSGIAPQGGFFARAVTTGSHHASILAVSGGQAEIASIDYVSWRLAQRHIEETSRLRVLEVTDTTPGLPLLTAPDFDREAVQWAVEGAIAMLSTHDRDALGIVGFCPFVPEDYEVIADRARNAPPLVRT